MPTRRDVFPVGLRLEGRRCLVVGNGDGAEARARALLEAGARVLVVSEEPTPGLTALARAGSVELAHRSFQDRDLDGVWLAVLTDRDAALATRLGTLAEAQRTFFCAIDQPQPSSFSHLAIAREGALTVAVSTSGVAPALARRLRQELQRVLSVAGIGAFTERLAELRDRTPSADRARVLGQAVEDLKLGDIELPPDEKSAK